MIAPIPALARALERVLALFYPEVCQICREGRATAHEGYICRECREGKDGIIPIEPPFCKRCGLPYEGDITISFECANCLDEKLHFRAARAAAAFNGVVRDAILRYKYHHASWFEPFLVNLLAEAAGPHLARSDWDLIVPIPLHWRRRRERSFNQAARLARGLGRSTGIPVLPRLLKRVHATPTQTRLTRRARSENVKRAFAFRPSKKLEGERIVLVDDVLTTGATASACAKILMQNGAGVVDVWTVARGNYQ